MIYPVLSVIALYAVCLLELFIFKPRPIVWHCPEIARESIHARVIKKQRQFRDSLTTTRGI